MELWLDSLHHDAIKAARREGVLTGVTTNPSIIAAAGEPLEIILEELLALQTGPIAVQVVADSAEGMIQQGERLYDVSSRLIIKIPVTNAGLEAIYALQHAGIPTMATAIFHPRQALVATSAGARYLAPYVGVMAEEAGEDPFVALASMMTIVRNYGWKVKVLAAALRNVEQVMRCAELGVHAVTMKEPLFSELCGSAPATLNRVQRFAVDWHQAKATALLG